MNKYKKLNPLNEFICEAKLDYHEFGELTLYDIEKLLNEFIEDCNIAGFKQLLVISGKGKTVRPTVSRLLKQNKAVKEYKTANYFNGGEGAYEVWI